MDAAGLAAEPSRLVSKTGARTKNIIIESTPGMTLDQRAVMLATAISIDFDNFSRHSGSTSMGWMPMWFPMSGGAADAGGAAGTGVEAAESAGAAGNTPRGLGAGEGATASAGPIAGYESMQRARNNQRQDDASSAAVDPYEARRSPQQGQLDQKNLQEEVRGKSTWGNSNKDDSSPWGQGGGGEGQGGGREAGGLFDDFFIDS